eukprot:jgi/Orpsp1_1/1181910/evm.model.c7180000079113.1
MYITMNYDLEKQSFEPSHINIMKNTTNEVIWSYPPRYDLTELYSNDETFIMTFDGLIYNKETNEAIDVENIGSSVYHYYNTGSCIVLREDGAYAYGESKQLFFEKQNSHKLELNDNDGNIYINGLRYIGTNVFNNLPSKLYCDIIDNNFAIVLEDSLGSGVWEYPPIKKYSLSKNGIYMVGIDEPISYTNNTISYITLKRDGLYIDNDDNQLLLKFEFENFTLPSNEKELKTLKLYCESFNGIFGMALSLNGNSIWRYPTYNKKTELRIGSK